MFQQSCNPTFIMQYNLERVQTTPVPCTYSNYTCTLTADIPFLLIFTSEPQPLTYISMHTISILFTFGGFLGGRFSCSVCIFHREAISIEVIPLDHIVKSQPLCEGLEVALCALGSRLSHWSPLHTKNVLSAITIPGSTYIYW